jgi:hypothetical protein
VDIDRVQASEDLHATLRPVIATLDHHECTASTYPLRIGMGIVIRNAEVCERINKVCSLVRRIPLNGGVGSAALGVIKSEMYITACKTLVDQLLHDVLSIYECVI